MNLFISDSICWSRTYQLWNEINIQLKKMIRCLFGTYIVNLACITSYHISSYHILLMVFVCVSILWRCKLGAENQCKRWIRFEGQICRLFNHLVYRIIVVVVVVVVVNFSNLVIPSCWSIFIPLPQVIACTNDCACRKPFRRECPGF